MQGITDTDPRPRVQIICNSKQVSALLDTGSEMSYISEDFQIARRFKVSRIDRKVNFAVGSSTITHASNLHLRIKGQSETFYETLQIIKGMKENLVLGCDMIKKMNIDVREYFKARKIQQTDDIPTCLEITCEDHEDSPNNWDKYISSKTEHIQEKDKKDAIVRTISKYREM